MTTPAVHLPDVLRRQIIHHCLCCLPNEGCGLIATDHDALVRVYPTANLDASPTGYTVPPSEHMAALTDAESNGWALGGVFHSHPSGAGVPSAVDMATALDPDWLYLVVSLVAETEVRGWRIRDGKPIEVTLVSAD